MKYAIVRQAIEAVCHEIIRIGGTVFPMEIRFAYLVERGHPQPDTPAPVALPPKPPADEPIETEPLEIDVPAIFLRLSSEYYHLDPKELAEMLIDEFCCNPPRSLTIISHDAPDGDERGDDDESPPETNRLNL